MSAGEFVAGIVCLLAGVVISVVVFMTPGDQIALRIIGGSLTGWPIGWFLAAHFMGDLR